MKLATWNVNGVRARQAQLLEWVQEHEPDILCLQEIKAKPEQVPEPLCSLEGYECYWHGAGGYSGVGLHMKRASFPEGVEYRHPAFDHETRIVEGRSGNLVVASVYVPNGGKDYEAKLQFLAEMARYAETTVAEGYDLIICGDLNVARSDRDVHPKELKPHVIGQRPEERELFEQLFAAGLRDVGRELDPDNDSLFTWWAPWRNMRERNIGWRIDYVLASQRLAAGALSSRVFREVGTSDHAPLLIDFGYEVAVPTA